MKQFVRPLLFLLAVGSVLLLSDLHNRNGTSGKTETIRIAVFRFSSNQSVGEAEEALLKVLRASDTYRKGHMEIKRYCAEGDMPTANMIARNIVVDKFNMVVTLSTPGLQVMANANKEGQVMHVFCAVTEPQSAGVGITGPGANQHPAHLVGIGSFQPVENTFRIARLMNPSLKKVGVVWCPGEACSEACLKKARIICNELGIELVEMSVETVSQVYEATLAICLKGVEALWIGGDNIVETGMELYVGAANKYRIPVLSNNPKHALKGAMVNLGANYTQVGQTAGDLVMSIINGLPATQIGIKNVLPEKLFINDSVRKQMKGHWVIPEDVLARADSIIR